MHSADQDGLKNYYTFAYQSAYSNESWKFEGMNYPYGEHVIYTDGQPLFGFLFGWLPIKGYEVGLLNMIMYLSILLAAFLVWKILITLKVSNWTAAAGTIGIVLLSPQFYRLGGHYALSIMWVIPLVLYQLIKLWDSDAVVKRSVLLSVTIFTLFFIHPYLGLMSLVFSVITILIYLLVRQFHWKKALGTLLIIGCSAILFKLTLSLTDTHLNRTEKPHGLFEHYALAETVFLPYFSPFKSMMERVIPVKHGQPFEGWGYIGLMSIVVLSGSIIYWIIRMLKGNKSEFKKKDLVLPVFFASVIVLLFSMLIPLKWFPEEFVYKLKVFNQFRSVGRFSWVFYYVTGITVIVLLDRFSRTNSAWKRISATCLIVLFPLMNMAESWEAYKFFCTQTGNHQICFLKKISAPKRTGTRYLRRSDKKRMP
jgi:hypothetical protein